MHSIMECEEQVLELMVLLDQAVEEATVVEQSLTEYDHKLQVWSATAGRRFDLKSISRM